MQLSGARLIGVALVPGFAWLPSSKQDVLHAVLGQGFGVGFAMALALSRADAYDPDVEEWWRRATETTAIAAAIANRRRVFLRDSDIAVTSFARPELRAFGSGPKAFPRKPAAPPALTPPSSSLGGCLSRRAAEDVPAHEFE